MIRSAGDIRVFVLCMMLLSALGIVALGLNDTFKSFVSHENIWDRAIGKDAFSERLTSESLVRYADVGDADIGGFMLAFQKEVHIAAVKVIDGPEVTREFYPYISNFNFQYTVGRTLIDLFGFSGETAQTVLSTLAFLGLAGTISALVVWTRNNLGAHHALAVFAIMGFSALLLLRGTSTYWLIFLSFLPFLASLLLYRSGPGTAPFARLLLIVFVLILIKSLTGYEYLSNVALAAAVPVLYYEIRDNGYAGSTLWRIFVRAAVIGAVCVLGFACALLLHYFKLSAFFGSSEKGLEAIQLIASYSTVGSDTGIRGGPADQDKKLSEFIWMLLRTFYWRNWYISYALVAVLAVLVLRTLAPGGWGRQQRANIVHYLRGPLFPATLLALLTTVSWTLLAGRHAQVHPHINWIQSYIVFLPFLAMSLAELFAPAQTVLRRRASNT